MASSSPWPAVAFAAAALGAGALMSARRAPAPAGPSAAAAPGAASTRVVGMVLELRPECEAEYRRLHAASHAGVRDLLVKYHLRAFSIFLQRVDGRLLEFGTYTYCGSNFERDMALLDAEPRNKAWLAVCDPMQRSVSDAKGWTIMESVYSNA